MLPHDQKIGIKGDNPQPFLIIPSDTLTAVHQEIWNTLVNVNRHENSEMDLAIQLNTSLIFVALGIWLSTLSAQILKTCPMSQSFTIDFRRRTAFLPFLLSNCYLTGFFSFCYFVRLLTLCFFFSSFPVFVLAPIRL